MLNRVYDTPCHPVDATPLYFVLPIVDLSPVASAWRASIAVEV